MGLPVGSLYGRYLAWYYLILFGFNLDPWNLYHGMAFSGYGILEARDTWRQDKRSI